MISKNYLNWGLQDNYFDQSTKFKKKIICAGCPASAVRGCKLIFLQKKFIGVYPTKNWEKSQSFRYVSSEDFLSKGQKTAGWGCFNAIYVNL